MIGDIIREVGGVVNKLVPDSDLRTKLQHELDTQEFQARIKQIEVNARAAEHGSFFVAGARPFIMWGCGIVLMLQALAPLIDKVFYALGYPVPDVPINVDMSFELLMALLGLGGARSWEKSRGVARSKL